MRPFEAILQAFGSIRANKLRSFLTMLGVIIGVSAMLLMVAVVEGFQTNVRKQFEGLGSRLVFIFYNPDENARRKARRTFEGLKLDDARALRAECDLLDNVAAELELGQQRVVSGSRQWSIADRGRGAAGTAWCAACARSAAGSSTAMTWRSGGRSASSGSRPRRRCSARPTRSGKTCR